ncbi:MAG: hypothetical protein NUW37_05965 [Planctomycetes bacterium]|nr:hypothetical protein [Planctomycetota bacterium]
MPKSIEEIYNMSVMERNEHFLLNDRRYLLASGNESVIKCFCETTEKEVIKDSSIEDTLRTKTGKKSEEVAQALDDLIRRYRSSPSNELLMRIREKFRELAFGDIGGAGVSSSELETWKSFFDDVNCGIIFIRSQQDRNYNVYTELPGIHNPENEKEADGIEHTIQFALLWSIAYLYFFDVPRPASKHDMVIAFQSALKAMGFPVSIDGDWGPETNDAWKRFKELSLVDIVQRSNTFEEAQEQQESGQGNEEGAISPPSQPENVRTLPGDSDIDLNQEWEDREYDCTENVDARKKMMVQYLLEAIKDWEAGKPVGHPRFRGTDAYECPTRLLPELRPFLLTMLLAKACQESPRRQCEFNNSGEGERTNRGRNDGIMQVTPASGVRSIADPNAPYSNTPSSIRDNMRDAVRALCETLRNRRQDIANDGDLPRPTSNAARMAAWMMLHYNGGPNPIRILLAGNGDPNYLRNIASRISSGCLEKFDLPNEEILSQQQLNDLITEMNAVQQWVDNKLG